MESISIVNNINSDSESGSAELGETFGMSVSCFEYPRATSFKTSVSTTFRNADPQPYQGGCKDAQINGGTTLL